jgi:hypothetical protein
VIEPRAPALQALYDDERAAPVAGPEERARIRARVLATLGVEARGPDRIHGLLVDPDLEETS